MILGTSIYLKLLKNKCKVKLKNKIKFKKSSGKFTTLRKAKGRKKKNDNFSSLSWRRWIVMIKYFITVEILSTAKRKSLKAHSFRLKCTVTVITYNDVTNTLTET